MFPSLAHTASLTAQTVAVQLQPPAPGQAGPGLQHLHGGDRPALATPCHLARGGGEGEQPPVSVEVRGEGGGGV